MKKHLSLLLLLPALFIPCSLLHAQAEYQPIVIQSHIGNLTIEIRPEIELLAGVLSQTSWMDIRGPRGTGNPYFRELRKFFAPYKNHQAVVIAEQLTKSGFTYDAPPGFILSLGPLPFLEPINGYSDYLLQRAKGKDVLDDFRRELAKLAADSNFAGFFEEHREYLGRILNSSVKGFNGAKMVEWLQQFFGSKGDSYCLLFAPAFPGGGSYSFTHIDQNGKKAFYEIIRDKSVGSGKVQFPDGQTLESSATNGWGRSFVKPAVEINLAGYPGLEELYIPVKEQMAKMTYTQMSTFYTEQILRAVNLIWLGETQGFSSYNYTTTLQYTRRQGFYMAKFTVERLLYYKEHRGQYPTFADFVPDLFAGYLEHKDEL